MTRGRGRDRAFVNEPNGGAPNGAGGKRAELASSVDPSGDLRCSGVTKEVFF